MGPPKTHVIYAIVYKQYLTLFLALVEFWWSTAFGILKALKSFKETYSRSFLKSSSTPMSFHFTQVESWIPNESFHNLVQIQCWASQKLSPLPCILSLPQPKQSFREELWAGGSPPEVSWTDHTPESDFLIFMEFYFTYIFFHDALHPI